MLKNLLFISSFVYSAKQAFGHQLKFPGISLKMEGLGTDTTSNTKNSKPHYSSNNAPVLLNSASETTNPCDVNIPVDPSTLPWDQNGTAPWYAAPATKVFSNSIVTDAINLLQVQPVPGLPSTFGQTFKVFQDAGCLLYVHGGAIRDFLLNISAPKDIDIEYSCSPKVLNRTCIATYGQDSCHVSGSYFYVGKAGPECEYEELEGVNWKGTIFGPAYTKEYTTNALSYDINGNDVIIDLVGSGVNDTCSHLIRIPVPESQWWEWMTEDSRHKISKNSLMKLPRYWKLRADPKEFDPADEDTASYIESNVKELWQNTTYPVETTFRKFYCNTVSGKLALDNSGCYVEKPLSSSLKAKLAAYNEALEADMGSQWYNSQIVENNVNKMIATLDLTDLNGNNGFMITDIKGSTTSVKNLGDVNGDGIDDIGIGSFNGNQGEIYVIYGANNFEASFSVNNIDLKSGYHIIDNAMRNQGTHIGDIGDVNRDGLSDILGGTVNWNVGGPYSFVYFGTRNNSDLYKYTGSLNGKTGFMIRQSPGGAGDIGSGLSSSEGDFNGDGVNDVLTGAPHGQPGDNGRGVVNLIYGATQFPSILYIQNINGQNGVEITASSGGGFYGSVASSIGDINGDGIDDLATSDAFSSSKTGKVFVVFGSKSLPQNLAVESLNGNNGFSVSGINAGDECGKAIAGKGDFNGDGLVDIAIGAPLALGKAGQAYVVFGSSSGYPQNINLNILNGRNGVKLTGSNYKDETGSSIEFIGDFNNDGFDDLFIGAPGANSGVGKGYIVYGQKQFPAELFLEDLVESTGINITPNITNGKFAQKPVGTGDFNNDTYLDILVGGSNYAAVIFGNIECGSIDSL